MTLRVEVIEIGWDLSLRAQSHQALTMTSVWLQEEGEGEWGEMAREGVNLEGRVSIPWKNGGNLSGSQIHTLMEHDLEDEVLIGEEGKKRNRGEIEDILAKEETNTLVVKNRKIVEVRYLLSAAAKRQADRVQ
ncbi:hypothetical protein PVK06_019625 [Gossypium arboreum]|uniref:Uncharacterized protein n=1 Tax=Gossypium arboreum TaxID=29729 RepID=A0ABR0PKL3_GOSAR|nr:hypothetical protein PVK06_019625 [Gossypium arboreum]